ncbi:xanthine dehydrogenase accessory protein XdhC [Roseovarius pelagicus]|uniref:Xanthine dehydrogenase accessory protein XdhC n=1 Tax=Roseovarius pelagicus TaxID=2980108 RepID=A0ABY6DHA9_9RHOB|nr:xanthine dehydrogenase accessory protein XdhC [Roseovarius pelagicus]UXX83195.1 xanthine dehydrogenase accessory protein XdhC [Roseovarius pelagicus]
MSAIYVEITATRGSAPRNVGTAMKVTASSIEGTIGGGALEFLAIATARRIMIEGATDRAQTIPLGPGLGQCCGGVVTLNFTREERRIDTDDPHPQVIHSHHAPLRALWIWGAGHVGRAVVRACPPNESRIIWVDSSADRFPAHIANHVRTIPAADMPRLAAHAPREAHHLIFTYSHEIDLALCAALLRHGFASCGVIGSATKWARFSKRLIEAGLDPTQITCPIGDKSLDKRPDTIARSTIAALLRERTPA